MIALNAHIFREYDIRGVAERDLTDEVATAIGRGYVTILQRAQAGGGAKAAKALKIAVGIDCRVSGPRLRNALIDGLTKAGADVVEIGMGPTPMLYFAVNHLGLDGGIMITGSHNPGDENGFKMMKGKASFYGEDIRQLLECIVHELPKLPMSARQGTRESVAVEDAYLQALTNDIAASVKGFPVVLDAGNGAGGPLGVRALEKVGAKVEALFCDMDGTFPNHHPDPTVPKNLVALVERVKATGARVGLAFDGDADRLGAVDVNGDMVWGDKLLVVFARALLKANPGATVLGEVKCSQTLYEDIARHGGKPLMWKTGHSLIKAKMKETGALLAGEMSGHLFFADRYFGYDDALYAALRLVEILASSNQTLGEILADLPATFTTPELRVDCPDAIKFRVVTAITQRFKGAGYDVIDIDGARVRFAKDRLAWGLVRASNTGPILVLRFEAETQEELDRIRAEVEQAVAEERSKAEKEADIQPTGTSAHTH
jgi:phosphomannomutase / phosphoglucomutase